MIKSVKPLIEKRRRARINASLEQLRKLLQQTPDQQNTRVLSRLEKAEILEMTVEQLHRLKQQAAAVSPSQDSRDFAAGYRHCINTVSSFLSSAGSSLSQDIKSRILQQLEETPGAKPSIAPALFSRVWQPPKTDSFSFSESSFSWASHSLPPPMPARPPPPHSDFHTITVESSSRPPPASTLPVCWTQQTSPTTTSTTLMWRPW
ncbi:transcription factor HES-2-like isoform X2 [Hemicordylus capensis]|uniref:transcription factor HES-2-like isoform X2 n=1 Tax=Hemicordylus capensis TaxID=884348 RepID=UPI00230203F5|nr:transcription factor HES-2-like isoform X2 [Hemicordylus capensis]